MERRKSRLWVDPKFKMVLKTEAAKRDTSILNLTKSMAETKELSLFEKAKEEKKKGKRSLFDGIRF